MNNKQPITLSPKLVLLLILLYFIASAVYYPTTDCLNPFLNGYFECKMKKEISLPCMGCGGSRAAYYFITAQWKKSIEHHFPVFLISLSSLFMIPRLLYLWFKKRQIKIKMRTFNRVALYLLALFLLHWGSVLFNMYRRSL